MSLGNLFSSDIASAVARKLVEELSPACERIEVVGSLRRKRPHVHDIDVVVVPDRSGESLNATLHALMTRGSLSLQRSGERVKSFIAAKTGIPIDIYIASPATFSMLVLIRTGSREHNIRLAARAKELGMRLKASGEGLEDRAGSVIQIENEEDVFRLLQLAYVPPEARG